MPSSDFIDLHASPGSGAGTNCNEHQNPIDEPNEVDPLPVNSELNEDNPVVENMEIADVDMEIVEDGAIVHKHVEITEISTVAEEIISSSSRVYTENGSLASQNESPVIDCKIEASHSGVKRARATYEQQQQPSVHVMFKSLTRDSKRKLEELLRQWSEWDAMQVSTSHDTEEVLESGEETFFPALHVGPLKSSAVSFWIDNQTRTEQNKEVPSSDRDTVPLYDREYAFGLASDDASNNLEREASRCFNCGSYNHSLKECPKPRDNAAVNNARKQLNSKRKQNPGSRNPTRYYQDSPGGKYDGLRPGSLDAETRKVLGLGELDPPPWLNRMREIGYPPGYLDAEEEDEPSGITIFGDCDAKANADGETKEGEEDGEILETGRHEPKRKMSVKFPGINAPIPENADERRWAAGPSNSNQSRNHHHSNHRASYRDQRRARDHREDGPPSGPDPGFPPISLYPPRYMGYDPSYNSHSPRENMHIPRSPILGRSFSDRGRMSPLGHEGSPHQSPYGSFPPYSPNPQVSPHGYGSGGSGNWGGERRREYNHDYSSQNNDTHERRHHHGRR